MAKTNVRSTGAPMPGAGFPHHYIILTGKYQWENWRGRERIENQRKPSGRGRKALALFRAQLFSLIRDFNSCMKVGISVKERYTEANRI